METLFQFVQLDKSERLEEFIIERLDKLENKYDSIIKAQIYFKKQEGQDPKGFICNINLSLPGPHIFAESNEESFEAAGAETIRDLEKQLAKKKGQMKSY